MTTLAEARQAMADLLSAVDGVERVEASSGRALLRAGHGWVNVGPVTPARFGGVCNVTLTAVVVAGADKASADEALNTLLVPCLNAVTSDPDLGFFNASAEPTELPVTLPNGAEGVLYVLTVTITTEVS